ncbi:MAG: hypothetical protein GY790_11860, partial [Bacteroidetes bacterium]|nr:hypothetical protein [Bacteroidota bacterium]
MSLTALDYEDDASSSNLGINMPIIPDGVRSLEPAEESDSDEESYYSCSSRRASLAGSYQQARSRDRMYITGATAPSNLQIKDSKSPRKEQRPVQQVKKIINLLQGPTIIDGEAFFQLRHHDMDIIDDSSSTVDDYSFKDRADKTEERQHQGGSAAYTAYVTENRELIPFNMTFFGRGKVQGSELDYNQYETPGFAPTRGDKPLEDFPDEIQAAIRWNEHILAEREKGNFPLDDPSDETIHHHNDVLLHYWLRTGLLQENSGKWRSWYQYPQHEKKYFWGPLFRYVGNPKIFGQHYLLVNEKNFPGMICKAETIISQAESPILHYLLQGTKGNSYPTAVNYQIAGSTRLPADTTPSQWSKFVDTATEMWRLGKYGITPTGFPVQTNAIVLHHTGCTNPFVAGFFNLGELQGTFYVGGNYKVPQHLTNVPYYD